MGIRDRSTPGASKINIINLVLRVIQLIFAVAIVGFYAAYLHSDFAETYNVKSHISLALTASALSIITAVAFGLIPIFISYYPVAVAFVWDWIIFFIWCAVFAWMRSWFDHPANYYDHVPFRSDIMRFRQMVWVDLTAMLLWLVSAIMGPVCLLMDRKSLKLSRSGV